jgi:MoxR-like ATPase
MSRTRKSSQYWKQKLAKYFSLLDLIIKGNREAKFWMGATMLADGNMLLISDVGLGKTDLIKCQQKAIKGAGTFRIQGTPDLLPSDLLGQWQFDQEKKIYHFRKGPIFQGNFGLVDEGNRMPEKVQNALLQAMEERIVTTDRETFELPKPFQIYYTANPVEQEGTYPLSRANLDRFLVQATMRFPSREEMLEVLANVAGHGRHAVDLIKEPALTLEEILELQDLVVEMKAKATPKLNDYISELCRVTRPDEPSFAKLSEVDPRITPGTVLGGISVRAAIRLQTLVAAVAVIEGTEAPLPQHVKTAFLPGNRHRIVMSPEAHIDELTADDVLQAALKVVHF